MSLSHYFSESIQVLNSARQAWSGDLLAGALETMTGAVPSRSVPLIQQAHLCLRHYLCQAMERELVAQ